MKSYRGSAAHAGANGLVLSPRVRRAWLMSGSGLLAFFAIGTLIATAVLVTVAMFETLYYVMG